MPHYEVDDPRVTHPYATVLGIAPFLVRLACVKRAASVDSEPGSNSRLNLLLAKAPPCETTQPAICLIAPDLTQVTDEHFLTRAQRLAPVRFQI